MNEVDGQQELDPTSLIDDEVFSRIILDCGGGNWSEEPLAKRVADRESDEDERISAYDELGGRPTELTPDQRRAFRVAGLSTKKMEASDRRDASRVEYGLSGPSTRSDADRLAMAALGELTCKASDARAIANGEKPAEVAARRRRKTEERR